MNNNKLIFLGLIPVLMLLVPNVYAGGPRYDGPEDASQEVGDCYREGYESGFAHRYNEDRADECEEDGKDWYNISWEHACIDSGQTKQDCNNFKERNDGNYKEDLDDLGNENMDKCYDDGFEDEQNNPFDRDRFEGCHDYQDMYYKGFIEACESAGNSKETCERFPDQ